MIYLNEELCKGCYLCIAICPVDVYAPASSINHNGVYVSKVENEDKCIKCQLCTITCPDQVIFVGDDE